LKQLINQTKVYLKKEEEKLQTRLVKFYETYADTARLDYWADRCSRLIWELSNGFDRVYIILDGVEECSNIEGIFQYLRRSSARRTNLFISSGSHHAIAREMEHHPELEITYNLIKHDLARYIDDRLQQDPGLKGLDAAFKEDLKRQLLENPQAMKEMFALIFLKTV